MTRICIIEGCENALSDRSKLDICPLCRGGLYRWRKRSAADIIERRRRLTMYSSRMAELGPVTAKPKTKRKTKRKT